MKCNAIRFLLTLLLVCFSAVVIGKDYNPHPRPFMGTMSGDALFDFESDACLSVTGAPWQTISSMEGELTHMGRSQYHSMHCSTLDGASLVNGNATLVAANGDEIWLTYTASLISPFPAPVLMYEVNNVVVGGTGRFENASGEILSVVFVTLDMTALSAPIDMDFAGSITY